MIEMKICQAFKSEMFNNLWVGMKCTKRNTSWIVINFF